MKPLCRIDEQPLEPFQPTVALYGRDEEDDVLLSVHLHGGSASKRLTLNQQRELADALTLNIWRAEQRSLGLKVEAA